MKNNTILFCSLTLLLLLYACIPSGTYESVYWHLPKGSKLTKKMLRNAAQIYPYEEGLILVYNFSTDPINSDYYLLFFDLSAQLKGGCNLSSHGIHDFSHNTISSYKAPIYFESKEEYYVNKKYRTNNLPENITLNILDCGSGMGETRKKVITNIEVIDSENSPSLTLKVNFYQGKRPVSLGTGERGPDDSEIILDLRDIHIDENSLYNSIFIVECISETGYVVYDHYQFLPGKLDELYVKIFEKFHIPADKIGNQ